MPEWSGGWNRGGGPYGNRPQFLNDASEHSALPVGIICRNQYIIVMEFCRIVDQRQAFIEFIDAAAADRRQGSGPTDDLVPHEGIDLIDQAGIEEAALDGTAAFDEDAGQPFVVQELQGVGQVDGLAVLERARMTRTPASFRASSSLPGTGTS